jgi:GMP synthase (glutamine-hydrolysing)
MKEPQILIIDLSSQVAPVIARTLRDLGYRSAIFGPDGSEKWLKKNKPRGIILSGGWQSVYSPDALNPPKEILTMGIPILGICYGMQWLAYSMGGEVIPNSESFENKNYGEAKVKFSSLDTVFEAIDLPQLVWASHGDSVSRVPPGFKEVGWFQPSNAIAAMANTEKRFYAVQYHPEVTHTEEQAGKRVLSNFLERVCACEKDWSAGEIITKMRDEIDATIGNKKAIVAYSGGVDSSVTMALALPVLKERFSAFSSETGALRKNEMAEIVSNARSIGVNLKVVDDSLAYFNAIGKALNAEKKRIRFQSVYGPRLDYEGELFGASFIFQGTNAADNIESGKKGESGHIKSHHNTVKTKLKKYNPLQDLFKHEIRALAYKLGLHEEIAKRVPFPGPGIFLRINGIQVTPHRVEIVQWADDRVMQIFKRHGIYDKISQCPVNLNGVPTVGIKGDGRSYRYSIVIHPIQTMDFMTSVGYQIHPSIRREITRDLQKHPEIVRVLYDEGDKPPASTEWE